MDKAINNWLLQYEPIKEIAEMIHTEELPKETDTFLFRQFLKSVLPPDEDLLCNITVLIFPGMLSRDSSSHQKYPPALRAATDIPVLHEMPSRHFSQ